MKNCPPKKALSLLLVCVIVLNLFVMLRPTIARAFAYEFILNAESVSGYAVSASLTIGLEEYTPHRQQLVILRLFDASDAKVAEKRFYIEDGEDPEGTYSTRFTDLQPDSAYTVEGTFYYLTSESNQAYQREEKAVSTLPATGIPQLDLSVGRAGATDAVIQGTLLETGIGIPVAELQAAEVQQDLFEAYSNIDIAVVKKSDYNPSEPIYSASTYYSGKIAAYYSATRWTDSPSNPFQNSQTLTNLEDDTEYIAQASLKVPYQAYAQYFSPAVEFKTLLKPQITYESEIVRSTDAYIWCKVHLDPNDMLYNLEASAQLRSSLDPPVTARIARPYDPSDGLVLLHFEGLSPSDVISRVYDVTITTLSLAGRHIAGYTDFTTRPSPVLSEVSTGAAEFIKSDRAKLNGSVTANGNTGVIEHGFVYSSVASGNDHPEIDGVSVTKITSPVTSQAIPISFSAFPQGLDAGSGYYYRAYAKNSVGVSYGSVETFVTLSGPVVETTGHSSVDTDSAVLEGNVASTGGVEPSIRGFVLSRSTNPIVGGDGVILVIDDDFSSNTGAYTTEASSLLENTTYYYRAYISNLKGTFYGTEKSFKTDMSNETPTVTLGIVSPPQISPDSKEVNATFAVPTGMTISETGFVYALTENPAIGGEGVQQVSLGDVDGSFEASLTGLAPGTTYYYRAYAKNDTVTGYSRQGQFTTLLLPATGYSVPVVTRTEVIAVSATTATVVTEATVSGPTHPNFIRRLAYSSLVTNPFPGDAEVTTVSATDAFGGLTGDGLATTSLTDLLANTTYYLRAVTQNEQGTYYGSVITFRTDNAGAVSITNGTPPNDSVTASSATVYASLEPNGASITRYGVVYSAAETAPLLGSGLSETLSYDVNFSQSSSTSVPLSALNYNTTYYYRFFAENTSGISYGSVESFTTATVVSPSVTIDLVAARRNSADISMSIASDGTGLEALTQAGVLVSSGLSPEISSPGVLILGADDTSTGPKALYASHLDPSTEYHARAFGVTQSGHIYYGASIPFTTLPLAQATVVTDGYAMISASSVSLFGNVSDDGGSEVTARGFVYSTLPNPVIGGSGVTQAPDSNAGLGEFAVTANSLELDTLYYIRAYATNGVGTRYSDPLLLNILSDYGELTVPCVTTNVVTSVSTHGALLSGNLTSEGGAPITERGFVYGTSVNPAVGGVGTTKIVVESTIAAFSTMLSGLSSNTLYHVRAYAVNGLGTAYGGDRAFTTLSDGTASPSTPEGDSSLDYTLRTLADPLTGITVSGSHIHNGAVLLVEKLTLDAPGTCAACDAIRERMHDDDHVWLFGYNASLSQGFQGTLTMTLSVDRKYNGRQMTLYHCAGGTLETFTPTVIDGRITVTLTSLSPLAVFAASNALDNVPKTGDPGRFPAWVGITGLVLMAGGGLLLLLRRKKKA